MKKAAKMPSKNLFVFLVLFTLGRFLSLLLFFYRAICTPMWGQEKIIFPSCIQGIRRRQGNGTKYVFIKSTTVYVPSSELGLQPLSCHAASVPLPSEPEGGGAHSPAGEGLGLSQFRRLEKSLVLCPLCDVAHPCVRN
jgi:hypothetical protein